MTSPGHKAETLLSDWLQQPTYCYLTLHFYRSNRDFFKLQETLSHGSIIMTPRNLGLLASVARCQLETLEAVRALTSVTVAGFP